MQKIQVWSLSGEDALEKEWLPTPVSYLENYMDTGAW